MTVCRTRAHTRLLVVQTQIGEAEQGTVLDALGGDDLVGAGRAVEHARSRQTPDCEREQEQKQLDGTGPNAHARMIHSRA